MVLESFYSPSFSKNQISHFLKERLKTRNKIHSDSIKQPLIEII